MAIAWTRSDLALASFREWNQNPPGWAARLHVAAGAYAPDAGWSLDAKGGRLDLISLSCHRLRAVEAGAPGAIACRSPSEQICPGCASRAAVLFDFTNIQANVPDCATVQVMCCPYCSRFAASFVQYDDRGSWEWVAPQVTAPRTFDVMFETRFVAREAVECPPFAGANVFELDDATAIGGVPMWVQDADYPFCPSCAGQMRFLAQHDNGAIQDEGVFYAFFCSACHISAVNYQQT